MDIVVQLLVNGVVAASVYALSGLAFGLIFFTLHFFHFAHGIVFTAGPYFTFLFTNLFSVPMTIALPLAVFSCAALGCLIELLVYRPLRSKGASPLILLFASLGIYIVLQNVISLVFGDDVKTIRSHIVTEGFPVLSARITLVQILTVAISIVLSVAFSLFLKYTPQGKAMRALANDFELTRISGIDTDRIVLWIFGVGSALSGVAGILVAFDVDLNPTMGMQALMMAIVVVIIGGVGSVYGIMLGALLLGLTQHLGVIQIGSQWQDAIAFAILFTFLLFKPHGFLGRQSRKSSL